MKDVEYLIADESFQRWLSGDAALEEQKNWQAWLREDARNRQLCEEARKLWNEIRFESEDVPDVEQELARLQRRLQPGREASIREMRPAAAAARKKQPRRRIRIFALAASLFGLILLLWQSDLPRYFFDSPVTEVIRTRFGERTTLAYTGGVRVVVNADSRLQHRQENAIHYFELQGEAFFEFEPPQKNTQPRLIVTTEDGEVRVHGTKFAVYKRRQGTQVVVEQGRVEIRVAAAGDTTAVVAFLNSGELLNFSKDDRAVHMQAVNPLVYTSWSSDELVFDNTPLADIVRRLEETYAVTIEVAEPELLERTLSGSVENGSLQVIVEALARVLHARVLWQNGKILLTGAAG